MTLHMTFPPVQHPGLDSRKVDNPGPSEDWRHQRWDSIIRTKVDKIRIRVPAEGPEGISKPHARGLTLYIPEMLTKLKKSVVREFIETGLFSLQDGRVPERIRRIHVGSFRSRPTITQIKRLWKHVSKIQRKNPKLPPVDITVETDPGNLRHLITDQECRAVLRQCRVVLCFNGEEPLYEFNEELGLPPKNIRHAEGPIVDYLRFYDASYVVWKHVGSRDMFRTHLSSPAYSTYLEFEFGIDGGVTCAQFS